MKLNNKGFAITSVLYGLLILFVALVGTYLTILSSKKDRLDIISKEINDKYGFNNCWSIDDKGICVDSEPNGYYSLTGTGEAAFKPKYSGKYIFKNEEDKYCTTYLVENKYVKYNLNNNCNNDVNIQCIRFEESACSNYLDDLVSSIGIDYPSIRLIQVYYNEDDGDDTSE